MLPDISVTRSLKTPDELHPAIIDCHVVIHKADTEGALPHIDEEFVIDVRASQYYIQKDMV